MATKKSKEPMKVRLSVMDGVRVAIGFWLFSLIIGGIGTALWVLFLAAIFQGTR